MPASVTRKKEHRGVAQGAFHDDVTRVTIRSLDGEFLDALQSVQLIKSAATEDGEAVAHAAMRYLPGARAPRV